MASLIDIDGLIAKARKDGEKGRLMVYQNIKAKKQELTTEKNAKAYTPDVEISMIQKMKKDLVEDVQTAIKASEQVTDEETKNKRLMLAAEYQAQITILDEFLPAPINPDTIKLEVQKWITANGPIDKKTQGLCIRDVKSSLPGADGKIVSEIVRSFLN